MRWRAVLFLSAGWLTGCRSPTQIDVEVTTNVPCPRTNGTSITVGALGSIETGLPAATTQSCAGSQIGSLVLLPSGSDDELVAFKVVTAIDGQSIDECVAGDGGSYGPNCIVARRALRYLPHTELTVNVLMSGRCAGVACDEASTCVEGVCVPATLPSSTACEGTGCDETALEPDGGLPDATVDGAPPIDGASDAPVDATLPQDGGAGDAAPDAPTDAPADATDAAFSVDEAGYAGPVPGCNLTAALPGAPWPMEFYCPTHRNRSPYVGPTSLNPTPKWTVGVPGSFIDAPAVGPGNVVYLGGTGQISALDPMEGGVKWTFYEDGGSFQTTPLLEADGTLVAYDDSVSGTFLKLYLDGGKPALVTTLNYAGVGPQYGRGGMVVAPDGTMYAADADNAGLMKVSPLGIVDFSIPHAASDYVSPTLLADGTIVTDYLAALAFAPDGGMLWMDDASVPEQQMSTVAVAPDGTLRVAYGENGTLWALSPDGGTLWTVTGTTNASYSNILAVADDGTTYMSGEQGIDAYATDGGLVGQYTGSPCTQPVVDAAGYVYAVCSGYLMRFDSALSSTSFPSVNLNLPTTADFTVNDSPVLGANGEVFIAFYTEGWSPDAGVPPGLLMAFGP